MIWIHGRRNHEHPVNYSSKSVIRRLSLKPIQKLHTHGNRWFEEMPQTYQHKLKPMFRRHGPRTYETPIKYYSTRIYGLETWPCEAYETLVQYHSEFVLWRLANDPKGNLSNINKHQLFAGMAVQPQRILQITFEIYDAVLQNISRYSSDMFTYCKPNRCPLLVDQYSMHCPLYL